MITICPDYTDIPSLISNYFNSDLYQTDSEFESNVTDFVMQNVPQIQRMASKSYIYSFPLSERKVMIDNFLNGCSIGNNT
jgi:hypothetical protein